MAISLKRSLIASRANAMATNWDRIDSNRLLGNLIRVLEGMVFRCAIDKHWTMLLVSDGCKDLTGYTVEEICNNAVVSYEDMTEIDDRDSIRNTIYAAVVDETSYAVEYRIRCKDGIVKWVRERGAAVIDEAGALVLEGFVEDISERVQTQSRLVKTELRYRSIFENSVVGMFQTSTDGQYLAANQALANLYRYDSPDDLMAGIADIGASLYVEPARRREFSRLIQAQGRVIDFESEVYCRDGARIWIAENAHAVRGNDGEVLYYEGTVENITERRQHEAELEYQATHDALTGLPNRNLLVDRLEQAVAYAKRYGYFAAVVFIDLDNFKFINDSLGHQAGDRLLIEIARRLKACLRDTDTVARYGGDEFVLVLNNYYESASIAKLLERILAEIAQPVDVGMDGHSQELLVTCSIGVSLFPSDGDQAATLIKSADAAMYLAKEQGKSNFQFFTRKLGAMATERVILENRLRRAIERNEIRVAYQPKVDGRGELVGFEALARWYSPDLGLVPPDKFIAIAEETGLIESLSEFVLRTSLSQALKWKEQNFTGIHMAVNLSARLFESSRVHGMVEQILAETGLPGEYVELELTESTVMRDVEHFVTELHRLRALGVSIAIDDFGTGYSSLAYLQRLPIDTLKVDKAFVRELAQRTGHVSIAAAIVSLARSLGLKVVAEGVETEAQYKQLIGLGCNEFQGYLFSTPLLAEELERTFLPRYQQLPVEGAASSTTS
ncbi:MAG TPA: EAL domain-containing protein [Rhodocyclaceae bacterium]|nr:EAL domain-containing protein [Rhodocyclaceae bacterium]